MFSSAKLCIYATSWLILAAGGVGVAASVTCAAGELQSRIDGDVSQRIALLAMKRSGADQRKTSVAL